MRGRLYEPAERLDNMSSIGFEHRLMGSQNYHTRDREKAVFLSGYKLYPLICLPFGLKYPTGSLQRAMVTIQVPFNYHLFAGISGQHYNVFGMLGENFEAHGTCFDAPLRCRCHFKKSKGQIVFNCHKQSMSCHSPWTTYSIASHNRRNLRLNSFMNITEQRLVLDFSKFLQHFYPTRGKPQLHWTESCKNINRSIPRKLPRRILLT